jgi:hypothetical protein
MADIADLQASLKNLNHNGVNFNVEERFQLNMSLHQLLGNANDTDFEELLFWGKIDATNEMNYYIALGVTFNDRYEFPEKKFFWCSQANGMKF